MTSYLLLCNKLPKFRSLKPLRFCGSGTLDQLNWVVLAVGPSRGWSYLKTWLRLEQPLPRQLMHMAFGRRSWLFAGCWQEASGPCHTDLSIGYLSLQYGSGFPKSQGSEREEHRGCSNACSDLVSEVPGCHSGYICSLGENQYVQPTLKGRRIKLQLLKGGLSKNLRTKYILSTELLTLLGFPKWAEQIMVFGYL